MYGYSSSSSTSTSNVYQTTTYYNAYSGRYSCYAGSVSQERKKEEEFVEDESLTDFLQEFRVADGRCEE